MSVQAIDIDANLRKQLDLYDILVGSVRFLIVDIPQGFDVRGALDNTLGKQESCRQIEFVARCAHGDGDAFHGWLGVVYVPQSDLQRFLYRDPVQLLGQFLLADAPHRDLDAHLCH